MAILFDINQEMLEEWLSTRPQIIRDLVQKIPPNKLYLIKETGHKVYPYSYSENGTVTVVVSGEYNAVVFERRVFGIDPDDLEECDLPASSEPIGVLLTKEEDVKSYINRLKNN